MAIQNLFTSRDNNLDGNTYVGQLGRLWYNPDTNSLYASDGATVGGIPVDLATGANIVANNITVNQITSTTGTVALTGNLTISGNISPASNTKIGGIIPGPGVEISDTGLLTIDSAGLPISFGDFYANVNQLSMVNANEAMYLVSNGTGNINLIGGVNFYKPNGFPPSVEPFFRAKNDGQLQILVPAEDPIEGGVEIIGSASGNYIVPGAPGTMLQLTGNPNVSCRLYQDSIGSYSSFVGRRYNGNVASPTQVLAGQDVLRFNATAATNAGVGNIALAQIAMTALEDQTTTAQGSSITFTVTPVGSPATSRVEVANITVANGVSATKFTTTGNITAGNVVATGAVTSNSATAGIGYTAGAGGTVTQLTSKDTPVTLNAVTGEIVTSNATLSGGASVTFTLTNSAIANTDVMIVNQVSATNISDYNYFPICNSGSANITIVNRSNKNNSDAITLRYAVIKGAIN